MILSFFLVFAFILPSPHGFSFHEANFTIGALFGEENSQLELAFKYAVHWHNIYRSQGTYFSTNIQRAPAGNLFDASKTVCSMTEQHSGVIALFGPENLRTAAMTQSICRKLEIPHIQTTWQPSSKYPPLITLNFFPASHLLVEGIATIFRYMNWKTYAIVYQHDDALIRLQGILKSRDVTDNPVTVRQLEPDSDYRSVFKALKNAGILKIILDCEADDTINILQQAKDVDLLSYPISYLLTSLDAHTLDFSSLKTSANITMIRLFDPSNDNLISNIKSWEVGEARSNRVLNVTSRTIRTEAVLMMDAVNLLIESINHLHKTQKIRPRSMDCYGRDTWDDGYRIAAYMKEHKLEHPLSGPLVFDDFGRRVDFTLQIIELNNYKLKATWSPANGTKLNITISSKERQKLILESLSRQQVVVSSKFVEPYLMPKNRSHSTDGQESRYEGYAVDLIDEIAKQLNFTYKFYITPDNKNGAFDAKSQSWNGVIGDILAGTAQLGICDLTVTHQRRQAVDFSNHFMTLGISILYKKPPADQENMFAFIGPLAEDVWMYTATAFLGVSVLLCLIARMAPDDWENPQPWDENPEELENIWNLGNCMWLNMGSIMTQGCDILPKGVTSRMAVAMWWFFSLLMTSSYTANLAAYLSKGRMGPAINSIEDLIKQNKIKFGTMLNGTTYDFFRTSNYSIYQTVWDKMKNFKPSTFVSENYEGVRKVLNKNQDYAFFMESASMEYEINKHCELRQIGGRLDSKGYGIAMPMDAPYRGEINDVILNLQESGALQTLKNKWWKEMNKGESCEETDSSPDNGSLNLENVGGVFLVLAIGVAISFLISVVEFLWNVRNVSVQEHLTYWGALKVELQFALNFWVRKKAIKPEVKEPPKSREASESRSTAEKMFHGAASLLHLDSICERFSVQRD